MIRHRIFFCLFFLFWQGNTAAGVEIQEMEDLRPQWKIFKDNKLIPFAEEPTKSIHVTLDLAGRSGQYLKLSSRKRFYVFINSALAAEVRQSCLLAADSLKKKYGNTILLSVYQSEAINDLEVKWTLKGQPDVLQNFRRPSYAFSNFLLIATLCLIIFFTALFRTNPQLAMDYLNLGKLFYFKDRDDNQITLRIGSSVNLLFYLFCSLLASLAIYTAAQFSKEGLSALINPAVFSTGRYITQWLALAFVITGLFMLKLGLSAMIGSLFGLKDVAGFQFFNFVRATILSLVVIAAITVFCFAVGINIDYFILVKMTCALMTLGVGLLYFKLLARNPLRSFHLFSYLCATEIFPLLIVIKILLF
jgi:hypothetical protein